MQKSAESWFSEWAAASIPFDSQDHGVHPNSPSLYPILERSPKRFWDSRGVAPCAQRAGTDDPTLILADWGTPPTATTFSRVHPALPRLPNPSELRLAIRVPLRRVSLHSFAVTFGCVDVDWCVLLIAMTQLPCMNLGDGGCLTLEGGGSSFGNRVVSLDAGSEAMKPLGETRWPIHMDGVPAESDSGKSQFTTRRSRHRRTDAWLGPHAQFMAQPGRANAPAVSLPSQFQQPLGVCGLVPPPSRPKLRSTRPPGALGLLDFSP